MNQHSMGFGRDGQLLSLSVRFARASTPLQINMEPKTELSEKEFLLQLAVFQVPC